MLCHESSKAPLHCKAKPSDHFLWAAIKACEILLRFFLAGFQFCLFRLESGWCSWFLLHLSKLVIPLLKLPDAVDFTQPRLATPYQPMPSFQLWHDSGQQWQNQFLPLFSLSPFISSYRHIHAHTLWAFRWSKDETGPMQEGVAEMKPEPLSLVLKGNSLLWTLSLYWIVVVNSPIIVLSLFQLN